MSRAQLIFCLLATIGCKPQYTVDEDIGDSNPADEGEDDLPDDGVDTEAFTDATLEILSPLSGDFLPLGEDHDFEAVLRDSSGTIMDFEDIVWTTSADDWTATGGTFTNNGLDVGTHTITAEALLPNDNRLVFAVGGVLVQHEDAGTYVGDLKVNITAEYDGTPITTACIGAAVLTVDPYGEHAVGDSTCTISLLGFELEAAHEFDLGVNDGQVDGDAIVDLSFFAIDMAVDGGLSDGHMDAAWAGSLGGYGDLDGTLDLDRITRDTDPG